MVVAVIGPAPAAGRYRFSARMSDLKRRSTLSQIFYLVTELLRMQATWWVPSTGTLVVRGCVRGVVRHLQHGLEAAAGHSCFFHPRLSGM